MILPIALAAGAISVAAASRFAWPVRESRPDFRPDVRPAADDQPLGVTPATTGYSAVDRLLEELKKASASSQVPLGLLVGWIAKESGGLLARRQQPGPGDTALDERGYFQLLPEESAALRLQHKALALDSRYSINGGLALIGRYMGEADKLDIAPKGSSYYWRLVKLLHSMGPSQVARIVNKAKAAGKTSSWDVFETFALNLKIAGSQPRTWFPFVDRVFDTGRAFGFGNDTHVVVGLDGASVTLPYSDIPDPLDVVAPRVDSPKML